MTAIEDALMKAKFRGCILGALLGDCCGEPFEFENTLLCDPTTVQNFFDELEGSNKKASTFAPEVAQSRPSYAQLTGSNRKKLDPDSIKQYTDDTVMSLNIIECLIQSPPVDYKRMAQLFAEGYFNEPKIRDYGGSVRQIFRKLRSDNYENIYKHAAEQFNGAGSFGNGGSMRIAPVGLFYHDDTETMIDVVLKTTKITHTHSLGVNGAILQCLAVQQALLMDPTGKLDACKFIEDLIAKMEPFEKSYKAHELPPPNQTNSLLAAVMTKWFGKDYRDKVIPPPYQTKLKSVLKFTTSRTVPSTKEIVKVLGNDVSAFGAVPTAIYCFLRAQNEIPGVECDNIFRRTIQYVMTLGGDTDTIGAMAGAIAGAYYGDGILNENMLRRCERHEEIKELADKLYLASVKK